MNRPTAAIFAGGLLLATGGWPSERAWSDEPPPLEAPGLPTPDPSPAPALAPAPALGDRDGRLLHEAFGDPGRVDPAARVAPAPPAPVAERPSGPSPSPSARWIGGYWSWDPGREQYTWVAGAWRVPPPGKIWVDGRWRRDEGGWYRVPGTWVSRRGDSSDWRQSGPPATLPEEPIGAAPGPDYFLIPGQYVPDGDRVVWRPASWARSQPGWEWIPARWVRRSEGWEFRPGSWRRATEGRSGTITSSPSPNPGEGPANQDLEPIDRHVVARPANVAPGPEAAADAPTELQPFPGDRTGQPGQDPRAGDVSPPARAESLDPNKDPVPPLTANPLGALAPPAAYPLAPPGGVVLYRNGRVLMVSPGGIGVGMMPGRPPWGIGVPPPFPPVGFPPGPNPGAMLGGLVRGLFGRPRP